MLGGVNFVLHAAGWLEGGLVSSYEKFMMDADQLGMMQVLSAGMDLSENGQALSAIREVGRGSHILGCTHTHAKLRKGISRIPLPDTTPFATWRRQGERTH